MANLFISYSRKDSKTAQKLIAALKDMGHHVWVDWESILPASDWLEQIYHGIEGADAFIVLVSPNSIKSEVCNVEVGHAALNNKRIVPVMIKQVKPEDTNENVRKRNWVFLRRNDKFTDGLEKIQDAIVVDFEWVEEHSRLQTRALEWDRKKDTSLLLRGGDLRRVRRAINKAKDKEPLPTDLQNHYVSYSLQDERRRTLVWIVSAITVVVLAGLAYYAFQQRDLAIASEKDANEQKILAQANEAEAQKQRELAQENERLAQENEQAARIAQQDAENQKLIAQAQRSAARAQIYQDQPGELYTSTLLAVASQKTYPTDEANEILRKNISLLPKPVSQMYHEGIINSLDFNTEGDLFVTGSVDGEACVWSATDGEMIKCFTSPKAVNDAVFSADSEYLVTGDSSGEVQIIRTIDWTEQKTYNAGVIVWDIDISTDGEMIAVTRDDGRIAIVSLATGEEEYPLFVSGRIRIASFSPNGYYIAAGSSTGVVTLWNLDAGGNPVTAGRHSGEVNALAFSPNSRYLITGGADGYAVVATTFNGREIYRLLHEDDVENIAVSSDGTWFATVSNDRRIRLWDTNDGDERLRMSQDNFVKDVKISANGQWLATTGADMTVRVWNASTGAEMFQIPLKDEGVVLGFSSDGDRLVAADTSGEINIWDISLMPVPDNNLLFDDLIGDVRFSPSGDIFAVSAGPRVWLLNSDELSTLGQIGLGGPDINVTGNVSSLIFSSDSNWLGISTDEGYVLVYHLVNHTLRTFSASGATRDISFTSDSAQLLVSQPGGNVDAWNLVTQEQIVSFAGGLEDVASLTANSSQIALGVEDKIEILNANGEKVLEIDSPGEHTLLAFNTDGSVLASSNPTGFIEVWKLEGDMASLVGSIQKESVVSMVFNSVGTQLAVGTTSTVYLIDPLTVNELARLPHAGTVNGVAYSSDGDMLATASLKALQLWDVSQIQILRPDDLVDAACTRVVANFSEAQWSNLFGGEPYRSLCENLPVP